MLNRILNKYHCAGDYPRWYSDTGLWWLRWRYICLKKSAPCWFLGHQKYVSSGLYFDIGCFRCDGVWGEPRVDKHHRR